MNFMIVKDFDFKIDGVRYRGFFGAQSFTVEDNDDEVLFEVEGSEDMLRVIYAYVDLLK
jgi:hypothetical protein